MPFYLYAYLSIFAAIAAILPVAAIDPLPICIVGCINSGLTAVGCTYPDPYSCFCGNPNFPSSVEQCLESSCTPAEQAAGVQALNSACSVGKTTGVYSFPPIPSSSPASKSTSLPMTTTQPPSSTTTTGSGKPASAETSIRLQCEGVIVGALVILGTLIGHAFLH